MDLVSLSALLHSIQLGSFTAASEKMHLSQPAVSGHIKRLEEKLGVVLLHRRGSGVSLTSEGEQLLPWIEQIILAVNRCEEFAAKLSGLESGKIVVGCGSIQAATFLPPILSRFASDYPDIEVNLQIGSSSDTIDDLQANKVDLGIVSTKSDAHVSELLYKDSIVFIRKKSSKLNQPECSHHRGVTDNLFNERLLMFPQESGFRRFIDAYLNLKELKPRSILEINDVHVMIKLVEQRIGNAFVPLSALDRHEKKGVLDIFPLDTDLLHRDIYLVRDRHRPLSRAAGQFIQVMRRHASTMSDT